MKLAAQPDDKTKSDRLIETATTPIPDKPTTDTRLTLKVPTEHTKLSLGAAKGTDLQKGISGSTDSAIQLEVNDINARTLATLGAPSA